MKFAYHRIIIDGRTIEGPVVCEIEDGRLVEWHLLTHEEAQTEWRGGTMELTKINENASRSRNALKRK